MICHCTDCQTLSASAFRVILPVDAASIRFLTGAIKTYTKTAESGNQRVQGFCGTCGTQIYSAPPGDDPPGYMLRLGTVRQRSRLTPTLATWARSALPWVERIAEIPKRSMGA